MMKTHFSLTLNDSIRNIKIELWVHEHKKGLNINGLIFMLLIEADIHKKRTVQDFSVFLSGEILTKLNK